MIIQIPEDQQSVIIFLEDGFGYEKERNLFTNYEITINEQSNSKRQVYSFNKYSEFNQVLRYLCFFPVFYVKKRSILTLEYIQNLSKIQQKLVHSYCKRMISLFPYIEFENGNFILSYRTIETFIKEDVTEFIQEIFVISALNALGIENKFPKAIIQVLDNQRAIFFYLDDYYKNRFQRLQDKFLSLELLDRITNEHHKVYFFHEFSDFQHSFRVHSLIFSNHLLLKLILFHIFQ
jgi:hypothetical protein